MILDFGFKKDLCKNYKRQNGDKKYVVSAKSPEKKSKQAWSYLKVKGLSFLTALYTY